MEQQAIPTVDNPQKGWVRVTNVHPAVTQEELVNLFGFCGYVSGVKLTPDGEGPNQIAIVEFWDKNAAVTACLLSSALLQNQPIQVELYIADDSDQKTINDSQARTPGPTPVSVDPAANQSRTATVARLVASGMLVAHDVKAKAIAWDSGNLSIVQKTEILGNYALTHIEQINDRYHITEKVDELKKAAAQKLAELKASLEATEQYQKAKVKVQEIDTTYGISIRAVNLFDKVKTKASDFKEEVIAERKKQENK
jgi:hypothetical protein